MRNGGSLAWGLWRKKSRLGMEKPSRLALERFCVCEMARGGLKKFTYR
jgi:hypothetical protein